MKTADRARGKWRGILKALAIEDRFLTGKHGPCPFCEGKDRFRWTNHEGNGGFVCNQCGNGDGFEFVKRYNGVNFADAAKQIDAIVGGVPVERPKPKIDERQRAGMLNRLWKGSSGLQVGDPAFVYLSSRVTLPASLPSSLRFHGATPIPQAGGFLPGLLALVKDAHGEPVNIHRTFLGPNGKADIEQPRAMMPGEVPAGSAVRLFPVHGNRLGIAEGIETALAAAARFGVPTWAALNSSLLAKWEPPAGVDEVWVFGDCDKAFGGQSASYTLAHRLAIRRKLDVEVRIPAQPGRDWADSDAA